MASSVPEIFIAHLFFVCKQVVTRRAHHSKQALNFYEVTPRSTKVQQSRDFWYSRNPNWVNATSLTVERFTAKRPGTLHHATGQVRAFGF